jgi:1-acyl-sn-glycerol-3-phosphate acyltransferase
MLLSMLPPSGVVIKSKYAGVPLFSTFVKHLDFVSIDPDSLSSLAAAMEKCKAVLLSGKNLIVFPEGTRAKTGKLLPFGPFPFKITMETGAPLVPAVIHSDLPLMARRSGSIFPPRRFKFVIRFLPACRGEAGETAPDFARRVRDLMSAQLAELDKGTCWDADRQNGNAR